MLSVIMDIARYSAQDPGWNPCHVSNILAKPNHRARRLFSVKPTESTFCCETSGKSKTTCTHGLYFIHSKQDNLYSWVVLYPFWAIALKKIQELAGPCYEALASLAVASTSAGLVVRYKCAHRLPRSTAAVSQRNWTAGSHWPLPRIPLQDGSGFLATNYSNMFWNLT